MTTVVHDASVLIYLVERPFCLQLQALGWTWLEGDLDVPGQEAGRS
jgi:hypothetical protein